MHPSHPYLPCALATCLSHHLCATALFHTFHPALTCRHAHRFRPCCSHLCLTLVPCICTFPLALVLAFVYASFTPALIHLVSSPFGRSMAHVYVPVPSSTCNLHLPIPCCSMPTITSFMHVTHLLVLSRHHPILLQSPSASIISVIVTQIRQIYRFFNMLTLKSELGL